MKVRIILSFGFFIIALSCCAESLQDKISIQNSKFGSPEEVVKNFFNGMSLNNAEKVLSSFDISNAAKSYKYVEMSKYLNQINFFGLLPADNKFNSTLNMYSRIGSVFTQVRTFLYTISVPDMMNDIQNHRIINSDNAEDMEYLMDVNSNLLTAELKKIKIIKIVDSVSSDLKESSRFINNKNNRIGLYNIQDIEERVVLFSYNNKTFQLGFNLFKINNGWLIDSLSSSFAGLGIGWAEEIKPEDFDSTYETE